MRLTSQTPFRLLALVFFSLIARVLVGCGGRSSDAFFSPTDPGDDPIMPTGAVLVGGNTSLDQGGSTTYVVVLSRAAPKNIMVNADITGFARLTVSQAVIAASERPASFTLTDDSGVPLDARQLVLMLSCHPAIATAKNGQARGARQHLSTVLGAYA